MEYSDSLSQWRADLEALYGHAAKVGNVVMSGTEAGAADSAQAIRDAAADHGWWAYVHGSGEWVTFDKAWASHVDHGWVGPVIPSTSRHSARGVCWVTCQPKAGGPPVSVGVVHLLTQKSLDAEGGSNKPLQDAARSWAVDHGPASFVSGDVNMNDETRNVWGGPELTTAWDEVGKWPDTHQGGPAYTIDVISRLSSGPYRFTTARALKDSDLKLGSDHYAIEATAVAQ